MEQVVIVGNGISGITAARHIRKISDKKITVISSESKYFFSRTALMYVYMGHMKFEHTQPYEDWFWKKNRIELKEGFVTTIDFQNKKLILASAEEIAYDKLILALGSKPNKFGWPGQNALGVQGLYSKQDLELMEENTKNNQVKRAVIVGAGLIGVEMAEMLHSRNIPVTFLIRGNRFWGNILPEGEASLVRRELEKNHIDLRFDTELKEVIKDKTGRVKGVVTNSGEEIICEFVGLTTGVSPNIDFLKDTTLATSKGIKVNSYLETNQSDVYAIGDCVEFDFPVPGRKAIEQVWYTGRIMGETVAQTICGNKIQYKPGHWFNSAKFFDLEYQTYGWVFSELRDGEDRFYWEDYKGEKCMHFIFEKESRIFLGVNTLGVRLRHEIFDQYLVNKVTIDYVIEHLRDANFDPELYRSVEGEIISLFNQQQGTAIQLKKKSWKRILGMSSQ